MRRNLLLVASLTVASLFVAACLFSVAQERSARAEQSSWPIDAVRGSRAMVVSDEALADQAGIEILKKGGNAIDAAAAVGLDVYKRQRVNCKRRSHKRRACRSRTALKAA